MRPGAQVRMARPSARKRRWPGTRLERLGRCGTRGRGNGHRGRYPVSLSTPAHALAVAGSSRPIPAACRRRRSARAPAPSTGGGHGRRRRAGIGQRAETLAPRTSSAARGLAAGSVIGDRAASGTLPVRGAEPGSLRASLAPRRGTAPGRVAGRRQRTLRTIAPADTASPEPAAPCRRIGQHRQPIAPGAGAAGVEGISGAVDGLFRRRALDEPRVEQTVEPTDHGEPEPCPQARRRAARNGAPAGLGTGDEHRPAHGHVPARRGRARAACAKRRSSIDWSPSRARGAGSGGASASAAFPADASDGGLRHAPGRSGAFERRRRPSTPAMHPHRHEGRGPTDPMTGSERPCPGAPGDVARRGERTRPTAATRATRPRGRGCTRPDAAVVS